MQLKNYDVKIFPARLAQTFSGFGSTEIRHGFDSNVFRLNFCGFGSGAQVYSALLLFNLSYLRMPVIYTAFHKTRVLL